VLLVHAAHVKNGPGRQTDRADARWLATLRRSGVLPARVIPPAAPRDVRDLTRDRAQLVPERSREVHRGPGVLERATIKMAAVASAIRGWPHAAGSNAPSWPWRTRSWSVPSTGSPATNRLMS